MCTVVRVCVFVLCVGLKQHPQPPTPVFRCDCCFWPAPEYRFLPHIHWTLIFYLFVCMQFSPSIVGTSTTAPHNQKCPITNTVLSCHSSPLSGYMEDWWRPRKGTWTVYSWLPDFVLYFFGSFHFDLKKKTKQQTNKHTNKQTENDFPLTTIVSNQKQKTTTNHHQQQPQSKPNPQPS